MDTPLTPDRSAEQAPPPHGWYPDPVAPGRLRLWDGTGWTDQVRALDVDAQDAGPISFVRPDSLSAAPTIPSLGVTSPAPVVPSPTAASVGYGSPVDFRDRPLTRPEPNRTGPDATRGTSGGGTTPDGVALATWAQRVVATGIDWVVNVVLVVIVLLATVSDFWGRYTRESSAWSEAVLDGRSGILDMSPELIHLGSLMTAASAGVSLLYGIVFLGLWGATLGQRALRLRVVPFGRGNAKLGWLQAIVRTCIWTLLAQGGSFLLLVQTVNVLLPLWQRNRQTLHDILARTQVVRTDTDSAARTN